jgi:ribonuclease Z
MYREYGKPGKHRTHLTQHLRRPPDPPPPMRHLFEARLVNGPLGDPGLFVDLRDERRALLFDLGDVEALGPRRLLRVSHVFVSHTHMDHFAGFDALLRIVLGRKERLVLAGGPGFADQVEHKLRAYTWNVVQRYAVPITLEVHEHAPGGGRRVACFSSRERFARTDLAPPPAAAAGDLLLDEPLLRVRGRFVDHEMPCLAFAIDEKPRPRVARDRLAAFGVGTGAWLRELKLAISSGAPPATPISVAWRDRAGAHRIERSVGELAAALLESTSGRRLGYVTDLRYSDANLRTLDDLLAGVDMLFIESAFLDADRAHAERKNHLTARQAGTIARRLCARVVVPCHVSPRYGTRADRVLAEVRAAWAGDDAPDAAPPAAANPDTLDPPDSADDAPRWTRALR